MTITNTGSVAMLQCFEDILENIASEGRFEEYTRGTGALPPVKEEAINRGITALVDLIEDADGRPERTYVLLRAAIDRLDSAGVEVKDSRIVREGAVAMGVRYLRERTPRKRVFIQGERPVTWPQPPREATTLTPLLVDPPPSPT
jgi:hypothetical protein